MFTFWLVSSSSAIPLFTFLQTFFFLFLASLVRYQRQDEGIISLLVNL
jgi:hypothetical protein